jgi:hypothetical protein
MKAPTRLRDDPLLASELRTDLDRAATTMPAYDVAAGLVGLQAVITASSAASAGSAAAAHTSAQASIAPAASAATNAGAAAGTTAAGTTAAGTTAAGATVLGALTTKAVLATLVGAAGMPTAIAWPSAPASPRTTPKASPAAIAAPARAKPDQQAPAAPIAAPTIAAPAARPEPSSVPDADLRREIAQLARIKSLVEADPERAYKLAEQGDREFARGMLRQERAALAIIALANSGHRPEAERRMRAFLSRYPNGPAREQLQRVLGTQRE